MRRCAALLARAVLGSLAGAQARTPLVASDRLRSTPDAHVKALWRPDGARAARASGAPHRAPTATRRSGQAEQLWRAARPRAARASCAPERRSRRMTCLLCGAAPSSPVRRPCAAPMRGAHAALALRGGVAHTARPGGEGPFACASPCEDPGVSSGSPAAPPLASLRLASLGFASPRFASLCHTSPRIARFTSLHFASLFFPPLPLPPSFLPLASTSAPLPCPSPAPSCLFSSSPLLSSSSLFVSSLPLLSLRCAPLLSLRLPLPAASSPLLFSSRLFLSSPLFSRLTSLPADTQLDARGLLQPLGGWRSRTACFGAPLARGQCPRRTAGPPATPHDSR